MTNKYVRFGASPRGVQAVVLAAKVRAMLNERYGKDIATCRRDMLAGIKKHAADFISGYGLGQGIGLSPEEGPWLDETATGSLESGMCLTLHPCMRDPNLGAVMIGNTLAVSQSGVEVLTA